MLEAEGLDKPAVPGHRGRQREERGSRWSRKGVDGSFAAGNERQQQNGIEMG